MGGIPAGDGAAVTIWFMLINHMVVIGQVSIGKRHLRLVEAARESNVTGKTAALV